ncbi:MAG: AsmA family protein [Candidatus Krumholzibacteria bacterium]|nr:AsmA family protein [Candidatus Krumholzibacteria bacterium]
MRKKLIIIASVVVVIAVVMAIVIFNLEGIVNRNKDFFVSRAQTALGREVTIDKIGVTLRGGIGVRLENLVIADDPAFSTNPLLEAKDLQVNARLLPLLRKKFEVKRLILHDPIIRIIRDENGNLNTSTIAGLTQKRAKGPTTTDGQADSGTSAIAKSPLVVSLINIDGGELLFTDKSQGLDLRLTEINSRVEELDFDKPVKIGLEAAFLSDMQNIEINASFGPVGQQLDLLQAPVEATVKIDPIDSERLVKNFPAVRQALPPQLAITGPLAARVDARGQLPDLKLTVRIDATPASIRLPQAFDKTADMPFVLTGDLRLSQHKIIIDNYEAHFHSLVATGKGEYQLSTPPSIELSLDSSPVSLDGWNQVLPSLQPYSLTGQAKLQARVEGAIAPGTKPNVSGRATVSDVGAKLPQLIKPVSQARAEIAFTDKNASITQSSLLIGSSRLEGSANIESFQPLVVAYQAKSPALALDDVRLPNPKAKKPEVLNNVVVEGRMTVEEQPENHGHMTSKSGSVGNIDYQDLSGKFSVVGERTTLSDVKAHTLDGSITGSGVITMNNDVPTFKFKTQAQDLNTMMLFEKLPNLTTKLVRGKANMNLDISGTGTEWTSIQKTISGQGLAELFEGAFIDFNIFDGVLAQLSNVAGSSNVISQKLKDKYPKVFKGKSTEFKNFKSDFMIENGKLLARNLRLSADDYSFAGQGAIDFDQNLDLSITLRLSKRLTTDLIADVKMASYLTNSDGLIEIPFALSGSFPKAQAKLDKGFVNRVVEKALVKEGLDLFQKKGTKDIRNILDFGKKDNKGTAPPDTTKK